MRIDAHAHVLPEEYRAGLRLPDGSPFPLPSAPLDGLLATMEQFAIDAAVISTGPPGGFLGDVRAAADLSRRTNELIAGIVRERPRQFAGLAVVPLPDVDAALEELARAFDELALDGVLLMSNVAGVYLGDPSLEPLFAELERRGAYVFVHPSFLPYEQPLDHPVWLYEFTFETTRAVVNLIYNGVLERYPNIRIQLSHLGGTAPFIAHRIASLQARMPELAAQAPAGALEYLSRLWYDTGLSNHRPGVAATFEIAPLEKIVFGTDWPYAAFPSESDPAPDFADLPQRAQIDGENARALVPRLFG